MIYYVVLAALVCLAIPSGEASRPVREVLGVVLLILFGGLRYEVGTDWFVYRSIFDAVASGEPFDSFKEENGFLVLVAFAASFGEHWMFILCLFVLTLAVKVIAVKLFSIELNVALVVYFAAICLIYDVNGLRQGLAIGLILLAGWAAYRGFAFRFAIAMTLAGSVHAVALVALPLYAMTKRLLFLPNRWGRLVLLLGGCVLCYLGANAIATSSLPNYLEAINQLDRYNHYVDHFSNRFDPFGPGALQRIAVALVVIYYIDAAMVPQRLKALLYNAHAAALLSYFLLSFNLEFMARISFYYKSFDLITLPLILAVQRSAQGRLLFIAFIAIVAFGQVFQILGIPDGGLLPYRSVLVH
jgi:hypothetical protein